MTIRAAIFFGLLFLLGGRLDADQVEMQNGDRYAGKVISMTADTIVLQSEVLGKLTLARSKVASISLGSNATATSVPMSSASSSNRLAAARVPTNSNPDVSAALRNLGANTNFIEQVRKQFLSDAGPEANNKYDELVGGLMSGKIDMNSLRAEAKTAADQIRPLKSQGGDAGEAMDYYLTILDSFLKETAQSNPSPAPAAPTNSSSTGINIVR
jgi:hypothetical protein